MSALDGARLATSWLTVLPVRGPAEVDRAAGGAAVGWAPLVGVGLGAGAAALAALLTAAGAAPLLVGLLTVGALGLLTRGMHLDGLADTVDGLGCYGAPERALAVMRSGGAGPFAVAVLLLVLGAQAVAVGGGAAWGRWAAVVLAVAAGRVAVVWACVRGVPAATPTGLGATVAGTQPGWRPAAWTAALLLASVAAVPGRWWVGPAGVVLAAALLAPALRHVVRRLGGVTGDVLGAACEVAVTAVLVVSSLR
ncbi:hypothetical protein GCM10027047_11110 [Rhodococcus aerolatus]